MRLVLLFVLVVANSACDRLFELSEIPINWDARTTGDARPLDGVIATDATTDAASDAAPNSLCPSDYVGGSGSYKLHTIVQPFFGALDKCIKEQVPASTKHTHLAVFNSDNERMYVNSNIATGQNVWLGLTDRKIQTVFMWETDEPTTGYPPASGPPWLVNNPSNLLLEDCVEMYSAGSIDDVNCDTMLAFVCECDNYADDPANY